MYLYMCIFIYSFIFIYTLVSHCLFDRLDIYHTSPDSSERQYRFRTLGRQVDPTLRGGAPGKPRSVPGLNTSSERRGDILKGFEEV